MKCIADNTSSFICAASPIYHGCSLQNQLLPVMAYECKDDFQIQRLWLGGTVSWEKQYFDFAEKCSVSWLMSSTLIKAIFCNF
jgi:hypothetical protein